MSGRLGMRLSSLEAKRRAFLVSGGENPGARFLKEAFGYFPDATVIAADKGALYTMEAGRLVDRVLGDMDSLPGEVRRRLHEAGVPGDRFPSEKDDSDTALALDLLLEQGYEEIIMLAALGQRWDHSLANLLLSVEAEKRGAALIFWEPCNALRMLWPGDWRVEQAQGHYMSLIPFESKGMTLSLEGFYYPLQETEVPFGRSRLLSNEWIEPMGRILIKKGFGLCCITKDKELSYENLFSC